MKDSSKKFQGLRSIYKKYMLKYHNFQCHPAQLYIFKNKINIKRAVGSACKPIEMMNRSTGSG
jgi:hypothetical protein